MRFLFQRHRSGIAGPAILAGVVLLAFGCAGNARAQDTRPPAYDVKAAFVSHFAQFVEWPDKAFPESRTALVIGIYGADPFHGDLEHIVAGENINGHPVEVRQSVALADLKKCNVIFISSGEQKHEGEILAALKGAAVLTVTENRDHFSQSGFMINLYVEDDKVRFEINEATAAAAGLKISPKLLSLARRPGR